MTSMTAVTEYETGTYTGHVHPHNGYYAGDFGAKRTCSMSRPTATRVTTAHHAPTRASLPRR